jgi:hypothetical protein
MPYLLKTLLVIDVLIVMALALFRWTLIPQHRHIVSMKVVALGLLTPAVALFCGNVYIFYVYLLAVVAFNSQSRIELASTYLFMLPLMPELSVETSFKSIYLFAISAPLAMGCGALIGFIISSSRKPLKILRYDISIFAIIFIFVYIYNRDLNPTGILRGVVLNVLSLLGPYLLISRALRGVKDVELLLLRLCLGATILSVTALFQARFHWVLFQTYYEAMHVPFPMQSWTLAMRAGMLRTGGSMIDFSAGGLFLACVLSLMPFLRSRFRTVGFWTIVTVLVCGLIVSQSRGAWVAAIVGLVLTFALRGLWGRVVLLAGGAALAEIAILVFAKSGRLALIAGQTSEATDSVSYRRRLIESGINQIQNHPILGQSPDSLVRNMPELMQGQHIVDFVNSHLFIVMAAGIPMFVVWCGVWLMPIADAWRKRSRVNENLTEIGHAMIVPVMVALIFTSIVDRNVTWAVIALSIAGPCSVLESRRQALNARQSRNLPEIGLGPVKAMM